MVRGVMKGSLEAIRATGATVVGVMPAPGFESCGFCTLGLVHEGRVHEGVLQEDADQGLVVVDAEAAAQERGAVRLRPRRSRRGA